MINNYEISHWHIFSRPLSVVVATMDTKMLLLLALVGLISANPYEEMRSNLEFLEYGTNLDEPAYRLLDYVQPIFSNVDLDVYLSESRFNGLIQIEVNVTKADLTQIVLHQKVVSITAVSVLNSASQPVPLKFPNSFETDSYYELLKINFDQAIPVGIYTITISYLGKINDNPVDRGFYKGYYFLNDVKHEYATTQFQPYHARKAFPCFDEPQFKSRYVISITRDSNLSPSYSNMAINDTQTVAPGRIRETFLPTPIISVYLVAFHVSDFVETKNSGAKSYGIISRQGVTDQHEYAFKVGLRITDELSDYFGIDYYTHGQDQPMKNDHIALPDFPSGAMENWGMVNYREAYLLYDPENTNMVNKIFIATIMAHELAHKWFGNLVTCFWWSNLWLNESFASFFEYFGAARADPSLELEDQFVVDYVHSALTNDASAGATAMNWSSVATNPSISAHFSTTSYAKGASVLRMMEHFVGARTFRNALRYYLKDNAYGLGTPEALYDGFRESVSESWDFSTLYPNIDVGAVFDSWVQNPGAPVLNVNVNMNTGVIAITQERFQLTGTPNPNSLWHVPISWTHSGELNFDTKPKFVLTQKTIEVQKEPGHHWVLLNNAQSGLYRVNYDSHNWEMLASALRTNRESIHKLNRAQIVNDVLFFIRAEKIDISLAFNVLSFLKDETDYYVWTGALTQLDWLRRRLEHLPAVHEEFVNWMLESMETVINHLGYEEKENDSTTVKLNRFQILNYACNILNHEGCVNYSIQRWAQYKQNSNVLVPVNARRYVYCIGLRNGDASDYEFLFQKYMTSENTADMVIILRTLGCTLDQSSFEHYLNQSLYNDKIRIHDRNNAFSFALQGNPENLGHVLNFVYTKHNEIAELYGGTANLNACLSYLATYFTDFQTIVAFQTWLYANQLQLPDSFATGVAVINSSINNLEWGNKVATDVFSFLQSRNSATSFTSSFILLLIAISAHLLH